MGRVWVVVLGLLLAVGTVHAEKVNPVERLAADAAAAYRAGDFQRAVTLLERAYKLQPVAALLYNLAKAYEKLGDEDKAAELYGRYAGADDADPKLRAKAEARVASLRPEAPRHAERPPERNPPTESPREPAHTEPPKSSAPVVTAPPPPDPAAERKKEALRARTRDRGIAAGLGSVGLAALVSAVALSGNVLSLQSQFDAASLEAQKQSLDHDARTQALAADLLYAGGAVCVGVAAYFLWRGLRPLQVEKVAITPWASPTGGGIAAGGRF